MNFRQANSDFRGPSSGFIQALEARLNDPRFVRRLVATTLGDEPVASASDDDKLISILAPPLRQAMSASYLDEDQVAARLGVSKKTLQNGRWLGNGPQFCRPFGAGSRAVRYNLLTLNEYLFKLEFRSTSEASLFDRNHKAKGPSGPAG